MVLSASLRLDFYCAIHALMFELMPKSEQKKGSAESPV